MRSVFSRKLLILFLIILFTVLQSTVLNFIQIFQTKPNILFILIIFFSLNFGQIYGLIVGALCGLFSEATSGIPAGVLVFTYSLSGLILGHISRWVDEQRILGQICITFISSFIFYFFIFFLIHFLKIRLPLFNTLRAIILPASFYTACVSPILFYFLKIILNLK